MNFAVLQAKLVRQPRTVYLGLFAVGAAGLLAAVFSTPAAGFAILLLTIAAVVALIRPELVIGLLALYIPFEPFILKYVSDDVYVYVRYGSEALIYLLLAAAAVHVIRRRAWPSFGPSGIWLFAFIASLVVSAVLNHVPLFTAALGMRQILRFAALALAVVNLPIARTFTKKLLWLLVAVALLESVIGIGQAAIGTPADSFLIPNEARLYGSLLLTPGTDQYWSGGQRVTATLGRYDQLGTFLTFIGLLVVGLLYQHPSPKIRRYLLAGLVAGFLALALTYSRASWFGFVLGLLVIGIIIKRDRRIIIGTIAVIALVALYPVVTSLSVNRLLDRPNTSIVDRLYEAFSYERWRSEYYGYGRVYFIVETASTVFPASPIFGFGPGQYGGGAAASLGNHAVYDRFGLPFGIYGNTGQIDNNWLSLLGETGAVGVSLFIITLASLMRFAWRTYRTSPDRVISGFALGYLGAAIAVAFQAGLGTQFEVRTLGTYLWLVPALLFAVQIKPMQNEIITSETSE